MPVSSSFSSIPSSLLVPFHYLMWGPWVPLAESFLLSRIQHLIHVPDYLTYLKNRLMSKIRPGSVTRVDKPEDRVVRNLNVTRFLSTCHSTFGLSSEDIFLPNDLVEGSPESLARVSRTIIALVEISESPLPYSRGLQGRGPYEQPRSQGDAPPVLTPPPRSPLRPRPSDDRYTYIPSISSALVSSSQVDPGLSSTPLRDPRVHRSRPLEKESILSDSSSILSDTNTFSSLLDPGWSFTRNQRSPSRGSSGTFMTATSARTSYSSFHRTEDIPSVPSLHHEYSQGKKRPDGDPRATGSLDSGPGETTEVNLHRVAEEAECGGPGTVGKLGLRERSSSGDRPSRPQRPVELGEGKWPDDFLHPSSLSPGSGLSKSPRPILLPSDTPARKLALRNRNALDNNTVRRTLTVREEGKPATHFVSVFLPPLVSLSGCGISHSAYLSYMLSRLCFTPVVTVPVSPVATVSLTHLHFVSATRQLYWSRTIRSGIQSVEFEHGPDGRYQKDKFNLVEGARNLPVDEGD